MNMDDTTDENASKSTGDDVSDDLSESSQKILFVHDGQHITRKEVEWTCLSDLKTASPNDIIEGLQACTYHLMKTVTRLQKQVDDSEDKDRAVAKGAAELQDVNQS